MEDKPGKNTFAAFLAAVLIGGGNFIAVSFSNQELAPLFGAALRFAAAALIFFIITVVRGIDLPRGKAATGAVLYGLLGFGVVYACLYTALLGLAAGTVSVVMAATPLFTLLIAAAIGQERLSLRGVAGGLLTMAGISVLSVGVLGGSINLLYLLLVVVGALAGAASTVVAKAYPKVNPVSMNAIGMSAGAFVLAAGSLTLNEHWSLPYDGQTWLALGWLVLLGSVGLFQLFLFVIRSWSASAATFAISAMPVVAVALGAMLLEQPVTWQVVLGGVMVIVAVYLGAVAGRDTTTDHP